MDVKKRTTSRLAPWNWFKHEQNEPLTKANERQNTNPIAQLQQEMDRLFDRSFRQLRTDLAFDDWPSLNQLKPSVDISERDNCYLISVEIPGVKKEDMALTQEGDRLIIRGEKKHEHEEKSETLHRIERSYGHFQRVLTLPEDAQVENISAKFNDGVLAIEVPRQAGAKQKTKKIDISQ